MTEVELHIHVKNNGKLLVTPERIALLRNIEKSGSLLTAAKELGISYNKAWKLIDATNKAVDKPVVAKLRGGTGGGGATVTEYGKTILKEYEMMEQVVASFTKKFNSEINF